MKIGPACVILSTVSDFRYAQYCPLARATEILGERWTLLVIRELLLGSKRFSDLKRALPGVSPSILSDRLGRLEDRGVIRRLEFPPPTPASLYELSESGRGLVPAMLELARWGAQFLGRPLPEDHFEAAWLRLGFTAFARKAGSPKRTFAIRVDGSDELSFHVAGGEQGTTINDGLVPADTTLRVGSPLAVFALASRQLTPSEALRSGAIRVDGDAAALDDFPELFDMAPGSTSPQPTGE